MQGSLTPTRSEPDTTLSVIERPVQPGQVPSYAHPANLPQCMVHGHRPDPRFTLFAGVRVMIRGCRICGTVYTTSEA
jgi:hypothetical protein